MKDMSSDYYDPERISYVKNQNLVYLVKYFIGYGLSAFLLPYTVILPNKKSVIAP